MGNRARIVSQSRRLMNEHGAQAIGTTQITEALGISPGNLYYHFKNKEEIVLAVFDELERDFREAIAVDISPPISAQRFAGFYSRSLAVSWRYRFFFGGLLHLLRKDENLARRYRELQSWALDLLEGIARQVSADGNLEKPRGKNGFRSLALNTWLIWSNWVRHIQISHENHEVTYADISEGVNQIFEILAPYLTPEFHRAARRALTHDLSKSKDQELADAGHDN
ncbi:MAG: TetR/AcrR family transcriptional regulator [Halioglobus sp.]